MCFNFTHTFEFIKQKLSILIAIPSSTTHLFIAHNASFQVVLGTVLSYAFDLKKNFSVKIVGDVPVG